MHWIANVLYWAGLFSLYQGTFGAQENFSIQRLMLSLLIGTPLIIGGRWLKTQIARDETKIIEDEIKDESAIEKGDSFLYLRPFKSTNAFRIKDEHLNVFSWELADRTGFDDIENLLAKALNPTGPFIALGKSGEHLGAARIETSEKEWHERVKDITQKCRLILVVPSSQPGTVWELKHICDALLLEKTVFVMPPTDSFFYSNAQYDVAADWNLTLAECDKFGLKLPAYVSGGALFTMQIDQTIGKILPFPMPDPQQWATSLQQIISFRSLKKIDFENKLKLKSVNSNGHYLKWVACVFALVAGARYFHEIFSSTSNNSDTATPSVSPAIAASTVSELTKDLSLPSMPFEKINSIGGIVNSYEIKNVRFSLRTAQGWDLEQSNNQLLLKQASTGRVCQVSAERNFKAHDFKKEVVGKEAEFEADTLKEIYEGALPTSTVITTKGTLLKVEKTDDLYKHVVKINVSVISQGRSLSTVSFVTHAMKGNTILRFQCSTTKGFSDDNGDMANMSSSITIVRD